MKYEELKKGKKIFDLPLRVVYYRELSDKDGKLDSLENQNLYYENYIKKYSNWTFKKCNEFLRMIKDASLGKIDLIIMEDAFRFARDIVEAPKYLRELEDYGVGVYFEKQCICSMEESSTMILNFMFSLAQEEYISTYNSKV